MAHHTNGRPKRPDRQVILARDGEEYHLSLRLGYEKAGRPAEPEGGV